MVTIFEIVVHTLNNVVSFVKLNMSEVAKIEGRVRYSTFKMTIKVMITSTDSLDDLKAQLNPYFKYLGENQHTRHLFAQMPCMDQRVDKEKTCGKRRSMCLDLLATIATSDLCLGIWLKVIYYICVFVPSAHA